MDVKYLWQFSNKYWEIRDRLEHDIMHSVGFTDSEYNTLLQMYDDFLSSQRYCNNLVDLSYADDSMNTSDNLF